jgi:hypothetical protein
MAPIVRIVFIIVVIGLRPYSVQSLKTIAEKAAKTRLDAN